MVEPTPTEIARQQSLPLDIRGLPPEEVESRQSLRGGQSRVGGGGRVITASQQATQLEQQRQQQRQKEENSLRQSLTTRLLGTRNKLVSLARNTFRKSIRNFKSRNEKLQAEIELQNQISIINQQTTLAQNELAKSSFDRLKEKGQELLSKFKTREEEIQERQGIRKERILQTSKEDLSKFERIERFFLERKGKSELPFGLQDVVELKPEIVLGEKFSPFVPLNFFGRKISESKIGQILTKELEKESPAFRDLIKLVEITGTGRQAVEFLTLAQIGVLFDPAIRSGSSQEQRLISKKLSQNRFNELELDDVLNDLQFKQQGKAVRSKTFSEKVDDAKRIFDRVKGTKEKTIREQQIKEFKKLMKSAHGEKEANRILNELLSQERILFGGGGIKVEKLRPVGEIKGAGVPTGIESAFKEISPLVPKEFKSSILNQERLRTEQARNQGRITQARKSLGERFKESQLKRTALITPTALAVLSRTKQLGALKSAQRFRQAQAQQELLRQKQISKLRLALFLSPKSAKATKQKLKLKQLSKLKPKGKFPLLFLRGKSKKKQLKKIPFEITGSFDVFSKKRGNYLELINDHFGLDQELEILELVIFQKH